MTFEQMHAMNPFAAKLSAVQLVEQANQVGPTMQAAAARIAAAGELASRTWQMNETRRKAEESLALQAAFPAGRR
jgi:uncharacterized membrane protein YhhN